MNNQAEREAFEAAYKKLHPQVTIRQQNLIGTYTDQYVDQAAFWFQAGAAYQREQDKGLVEALEDIANDYSDRFDMESPSTNPGMKVVVENARDALAAYKEAQEGK